MSSRIRIALLGLTPLEVMGMREALRSAGMIVADAFACFKDFHSLAERYDGVVADAGIFASNLEYFMPRRQKTLVISGGRIAGDCSPEGELRILEDVEHFVDNICNVGETAGELSQREKDVIREVASGKTNKEIADNLCISVNTVITHRKNIASKLGIKSASGLSLYAVMNGLL